MSDDLEPAAHGLLQKWGESWDGPKDVVEVNLRKDEFFEPTRHQKIIPLFREEPIREDERERFRGLLDEFRERIKEDQEYGKAGVLRRIDELRRRLPDGEGNSDE